MYLLLAYLMVAGSNDSEIIDGGSCQIQCIVSTFAIRDRGIQEKISGKCVTWLNFELDTSHIEVRSFTVSVDMLSRTSFRRKKKCRVDLDLIYTS